ncbi:ABC transporter ATP-binding protein [Pseudarthrobacter sp. J1738]|uniref:ABC transporter ATP-binding protein n=1 Tax=unclassified Pseudarthrobacter TaxID=2647000 RepID=UPI003D2C1C85
MRLLLQRLIQRWPAVSGIILLQTVQTLGALILPTINAQIIDRGIVGGDRGLILQLGALMLGVSVVQVLAALAAGYLGANVAMGVGRELRGEVFAHVQNLSVADFSKFGVATLMTRTGHDVQQIQTLAVMIFSLVLSAPITGIGGILLAMRQDMPLSAVILVIVPALIIIMTLVVRRLVPLYREGQVLLDGVNAMIREQIMGTSVIRAFVRQDFEIQRFTKANVALTRNSLSSAQWIAFMIPAIMVVVNLGSVAVIWFGAQRIADGQMELGALTAFISYIMQILVAIMSVMFVLSWAPRAAASAERISQVLNTQPSILDPQQPQLFSSRGPQDLEFVSVGVRFEGAQDQVLSNISFTAKPGTTTAILGATGSGKSLLLQLIPRLLDPSSGCVKLGGLPLPQVTLAELRDRIAYIPQAAVLFNGTIAENVRAGNTSLSDEHVWEALYAAQAAEFVAAMPEQLEVRISQDGANLSGGQRQRIALARAFAHRPQVILFDDSFSALDSATEARIQGSMRRYTASAVVVRVAQKVSSVQNAEQILVLDDGAIVARGTHQELLLSSADYREIADSQNDDLSLAPEPAQ